MRTRTVAALFALIAAPLLALADPPTLPSLFADHMVLQRDTACRVWGTATPRANVTVEVAGHGVFAKADNEGHWLATLPPTSAGGPYIMSVLAVSADNGAEPDFVVFKDVMFGDVWVCSGQSNMEWPLRSSTSFPDILLDREDDGLRLLTFARRLADEPVNDPQTGPWEVAGPGTVPSFSAVGYHFGRMLRDNVKDTEGRPVPIGLIHSSWGGTLCEAWTPESTIEALGIESIEKRDKDRGDGDPNRSSVLYNAMIHPMTDLAITGAIWYQGESNADRAEQYRTLFPTMIESWRTAFANPEMPFYFVQLANFMQPSDEPQESAWAELREAQTMALDLPHTGMATIIDIGEANDIHPRNKHDVGRRLARHALAEHYGVDIVPSGPRLKGEPGLRTVNTIETRPGKPSYPVLIQEAVLEFDFAEGLHTTDGEAPRGFEVCAPGLDKPFVKAEARIEDGKVILSVKDLPGIESVRYAWADNPDVNLVNAEGLPAVPFRTDDRPGVTHGRE